MAENKLKPCPFCGEKDRISVAAYRCDSGFWQYVFCDECLAEDPVGKTEQDAVDAWNRRDNHGRE